MVIGREILQNDTGTEIVTANEYANAIKELDERIELAKQGVS